MGHGVPAQGAAVLSGPYLDVLRISGARALVLAAFLGRLGTPMRAVTVVLLVRAETGSFTLAGTVAATLYLAFAVAAPLVAHLVDRHGQFAVLLISTAVHVLALASMLLVAVIDAPVWTLFAAATVAGPSVPQLQSLLQSRWVYLLGEDGARRAGPRVIAGGGALQAAFALTAMLEEVAFVVGPFLAVTVATLISPVASLAMVIAVTGLGAMTFAAQRSTEPPAYRTRNSAGPGGFRLASPSWPAPSSSSAGSSRWSTSP